MSDMRSEEESKEWINRPDNPICKMKDDDDLLPIAYEAGYYEAGYQAGAASRQKEIDLLTMAANAEAKFAYEWMVKFDELKAASVQSEQDSLLKPVPKNMEQLRNGSWLWIKLMEWCKKSGLAPARHSDLFSIISEVRKLQDKADNNLQSAQGCIPLDQENIFDLVAALRSHEQYIDVGNVTGDSDYRIASTYKEAADLIECLVKILQEGNK